MEIKRKCFLPLPPQYKDPIYRIFTFVFFLNKVLNIISFNKLFSILHIPLSALGTPSICVKKGFRFPIIYF